MDWKNVAAHIWAFVQTHFLPIAFLIAVLVAMLAPAPGKAVVSVEVSSSHFPIQPVICHLQTHSSNVYAELILPFSI